MTPAAMLDDLRARCPSMSIDELKRALEPLLKGYAIASPIFDPGQFFYRARRIDSNFHLGKPMTIVDLRYPPPHIVTLGRANRDAQPMFYCSTGKEPLFFEIPGLAVGDELVVTHWKSTKRMIVNNVGYTEFVFQRLGAKRDCPTWAPTSGGPSGHDKIGASPEQEEALRTIIRADSDELKAAFSDHFAREIVPDDSASYKLTAAIAELHLGTLANMDDQFAGILYPSVRMSANGDNLALRPVFVDSHLQFVKATRIRIDRREGTLFSITSLDHAKGFDADGHLKWMGRLPHWQVQPKQTVKFEAVAGRDDDGDYESGSGQPMHWHVTDAITGEVIPAT